MYVISLDGSKTPARLVGVTKDSAMIKYAHIGGTFTFSRSSVVDENGDVVPFRGDE